MIYSRTNQRRPVNSVEELDDPLFLFEKLLNEQEQLNLNLLKTILIRYKSDDRYRNSPRYLKLWFMFILYLNTQHILPILYCLIDNNIGDKLAILYEAISYYQLLANKLNEAENTLLLGIRQKAEPIKRLERVLNQFYLNKTIEFDINQYTFKNYSEYIDSIPLDKKNESMGSPHLKGRPLKYQLDWIDVQLQHRIRTSLIRECHQIEQLSFEELRVHHLGQQVDLDLSSSAFLNQIKKDTDDIYNAIQRKNRNITPPTKEPSPLPSPVHVVQEAQIIPTNIEQETTNVTQLPHTSGSVNTQISSHGILERDDYHIYNESAQDIQSKLKSWSSSVATSNRSRLIKLGGEEYHVVKKLGEGGMAHVYLVENTNNHSYYGLKAQQPPHPWEFYIMSEMHQRRKNQQLKYYLHAVPVYGFHQYTDTSFLLMPHLRDGTLLDVLNLYRNNRQPTMPELIVLLFTLQLLKEITSLHSVHITHNDLKLDNIMLTRGRDNDRRKLKLPTVFLVDYGRSIDTSILEFPKCKALWPPASPQSDYPLLNECYNPIYADYWQLATMVHLLLFGTVMRYSEKNNVYKIQQTIRRYWHKSLWLNFFFTMLNPEQPESKAVHDLIQEFEDSKDDVSHTLIEELHTLLDSVNSKK